MESLKNVIFPPKRQRGDSKMPEWETKSHCHHVLEVNPCWPKKKYIFFFWLFVLSEKMMFIFLIHWQIVARRHACYFLDGKVCLWFESSLKARLSFLQFHFPMCYVTVPNKVTRHWRGTCQSQFLPATFTWQVLIWTLFTRYKTVNSWNI